MSEAAQERRAADFAIEQVNRSLAQSLTNAALAVRLRMIATNLRAFSKSERDAFLHAAANRLDASDAPTTQAPSGPRAERGE